MKLKDAKHVRWLSHEAAVKALKVCLPAVLVSLSREASERNDVTAHGLYHFMTDFKFIATTYMCCDVLAPLALLSRAWQVCSSSVYEWRYNHLS